MEQRFTLATKFFSPTGGEAKLPFEKDGRKYTPKAEFSRALS
jgi:hypothetical protein